MTGCCTLSTAIKNTHCKGSPRVSPHNNHSFLPSVIVLWTASTAGLPYDRCLTSQTAGSVLLVHPADGVDGCRNNGYGPLRDCEVVIMSGCWERFGESRASGRRSAGVGTYMPVIVFRSKSAACDAYHALAAIVSKCSHTFPIYSPS